VGDKVFIRHLILERHRSLESGSFRSSNVDGRVGMRLLSSRSASHQTFMACRKGVIGPIVFAINTSALSNANTDLSFLSHHRLSRYYAQSIPTKGEPQPTTRCTTLSYVTNLSPIPRPFQTFPDTRRKIRESPKESCVQLSDPLTCVSRFISLFTSVASAIDFLSYYNNFFP